MKKVVIFNGPPLSGKDKGADTLEALRQAKKLELKSRLISVTKAIYNVSDAEWDRMYQRDQKEQSQEKLDGRSPREALIHTSEVVMKPHYGRGVFAKSLLPDLEDGLNAVSDGGFFEEPAVIAEAVGPENVIVIRVHAAADWGEDSRSYIPKEYLDALGIRSYDVINNYDANYMKDILQISDKLCFPSL